MSGSRPWNLKKQGGKRGRPRAELEKIVRALLHLLRAGCPWRNLPCDGLNWRTVYGYFAQWRGNGIWERLLKGLARRAHGRICFMDASYVKVNGSGANPVEGQQFQAGRISVFCREGGAAGVEAGDFRAGGFPP